MPPAIPAKKRAAILKDIKAGGHTCRGLARAHGVSDNVVRRIARTEGIEDAWSRAQTENATRATTIDNKSRRAALIAGLLEDAEHLRQRAREPYPVVVSGREGAEIVTLPEPPLRDVQAAFTAAAIALDKSIAVERHDNPDDGTHEARDMAKAIAAGLARLFPDTAE